MEIMSKQTQSYIAQNEPYFHQQASSNSQTMSNSSLTLTVKYTEQYESVKAVNFLKGAFQITTLEVIMA